MSTRKTSRPSAEAIANSVAALIARMHKAGATKSDILGAAKVHARQLRWHRGMRR